VTGSLSRATKKGGSVMPEASRPDRMRGSRTRPDNHVIVMFGATGDLARRKLLPGLFHLAAAGLMPDRYQIIGSSRRNLADEQFRDLARQAVAEFGNVKPAGEAWQAFQQTLSGPPRVRWRLRCLRFRNYCSVTLVH
jgi:Glucose-6-phosphate dehydrogenase, NAD binding domain